MQNQASDPGPEGLLDLLEHLVDQEPTVPGELIQYLLRSVGADAQHAGPEALSLVGKAAEHFMGSILNDAYLLRKQKHRQNAKNLKLLGMNANSPAVLTTEDVKEVLANEGVHLRTQMYYADKKSE